MPSDTPSPVVAASPAPPAAAPPREPLPFLVPARLPDIFNPLSPARVTLGGFLGRRASLNASRRLLELDLEPLLAGFRQKPGSHPWIGEHIGKWMHAAALAWSNTGDERLRERLDYAARELVAAQEGDGYLGTYPPDVRFGLHFAYADWDVWSHKYCILGLLTYHQHTGSPDALAASRRAADLLIRTFGEGRKSILSAGQHVGMAATSVLEPIVLLYRATGEEAYLAFARYIVAAWDEPGGPRLLKELTEAGTVSSTADAKAYEMLSNLVGLCELARATGERRFLVPAENAWEDIVRNHLYITGTASSGERFRAAHVLPNAPSFDVGETCVTVTWIQLSSQLLRLTGDAKYADEIERSYYNHLPAAQRPDGRSWCYYTPLEGEKPYGAQITCCQSSGARGMTLAPAHAYFTGTRRGTLGEEAFIAVTLFDASRAVVTVDGREITIKQTTGFPRSGGATLELSLDGEATFAVLLRSPRWAQPLSVRGVPEAALDDSGFLVVPARAWRGGDRIEIDFALDSRLLRGHFGNSGRAALQWGPFVLAYDEARNPAGPPYAWVHLADSARATLLADSGGAAEEEPPGAFFDVTAPILMAGCGHVEERAAVLVPFADAGGSGGKFRVWVSTPESFEPAAWSVLVGGRESRSAQGNVAGSIVDGDRRTFVVTFDGGLHSEDFFAVELPAPRPISRVVYAHGKTFHDGGWFDASRGAPRVEIRRAVGAPWEPLGALEGYPATTATDAAGLTGGESFALALAQPVAVLAVRVVGVPACGDNPQQSFSSCAELAAYCGEDGGGSSYAAEPPGLAPEPGGHVDSPEREGTAMGEGAAMGNGAGIAGGACLVGAGEFQKIYDPSAGEQGPWYINDHCFIRGCDGLWHLFGITHAEPATPMDEKHLAHATSPSLTGGPWRKEPFAISADYEGWREHHLWAPHVVACGGTYFMFVCVGGSSPAQFKIHLATSADLQTWTRHPKNPVVIDGYDARDPNVLRDGDQWLMYYTATSAPMGGQHIVACRTSPDLVTWSERAVVFTDTETGTYGGPTESPFVVRRGRSYYLFICNNDRRAGYDSTDIYRSCDPFKFTLEDKVGTIGAHAAEVIRDVDGRWYVSRCGWGRGGVYLAPLLWEDGEDEGDTSLPVPESSSLPGPRGQGPLVA